ncbi:MAG: MFS transporter [Lentisphaerae bacterium]|nr:MFS transporter [Lentisphaerota bacterium]
MTTVVSTSAALSPTDRAREQRKAVFANLFGHANEFIVAGTMMMLYANDVLLFSPRKIATILALMPLFVLFRFFFLSAFDRIGYVRVLRATGMVRIAAVLTLIALPSAWTTYPVFLALILLYTGSNQIGSGTVWQPILRNITTDDDRGSFFARMRFAFTAVGMLLTLAITGLIGSQITEPQFKILLGVALIGLLNQQYWFSRFSSAGETPASARQASLRHVWQVLRRSPLLRRPLVITALMVAGGFPLMSIYFRQMLHIPSDILTLQAMAVLFGMALSFLLWGKVADTVGFRPMLIGLLIMAILITPLYLFITPFPEVVASWHALGLRHWCSVGILMLIALISGAVAAGAGIATTAIQHHHVRADDALEAMNLYSMASLLLQSVFAYFCGWLLQELAMPFGARVFLGGWMEFDLVKGYLLTVTPICLLLAIGLARRLSNARAEFGIGDFFTSIFADPFKTLYARRDIFHESRERRADLAHWFGRSRNPMAIEPLLEMLDDPAYDVKVETIRSLARVGSTRAGPPLLALFTNDSKQQLADHVAWALGELRFQPAFDVLIQRLHRPYPNRVRAMSARSLGKLGDRRAVPELVTVLTYEADSLHITASCCIALVQLNALEHADAILGKLPLLSQRDERVELMDALCAWFHIPNDWLLRASQESGPGKSLQEDIERRSSSWHREHREIVATFRDRDTQRLLTLLAEAARDRNLDESLVLAPLIKAIEAGAEWDIFHTLATAWLLYRT